MDSEITFALVCWAVPLMFACLLQVASVVLLWLRGSAIRAGALTATISLVTVPGGLAVGYGCILVSQQQYGFLIGVTLVAGLTGAWVSALVATGRLWFVPPVGYCVGAASGTAITAVALALLPLAPQSGGWGPSVETLLLVVLGVSAAFVTLMWFFIGPAALAVISLLADRGAQWWSTRQRSRRWAAFG